MPRASEPTASCNKLTGSPCSSPRRISHETAKTIIYGGAAAIGIVLVVLVVTISGGDDGAGNAGGAGSPNAPVPGMGDTNGYWASDDNAPPAIEDHTGVWNSVWYQTKTDQSPARDGLFRISHGSECELFHRRRPVAEGGGRESARCGLTPNGQIFAWYQSVTAGENPLCDGLHMGPPVRSGCSRTPYLPSGYFVECCVALDNVGDPTCPANEMTAMAAGAAPCQPPPPPSRPPPAPWSPPPPPPPPYVEAVGCMDATAQNYDPVAVRDDGSCTYPPVVPGSHAVFGCMDDNANNYNSGATASVGGCIYPPPPPPPPPGE